MKTKHQKIVNKFIKILKSRNIGTTIQAGNQYDIDFLPKEPQTNNIKNIPKHESDKFEEYVTKPISSKELAKKYFAYQMRIILHTSIMNLPQKEHEKRMISKRNIHANKFSELNSDFLQKDLFVPTHKNRDRKHSKNFRTAMIPDD